MQRLPRAWTSVCAGALLVVTLAGPAAADPRGNEYVNGALRKGGRGIANILTAILEIPRVTNFVWRRDGYVAATTIGLVKGTWRAGVRWLVGFYEVGTFMVPVPARFEPLMMPEFVFAHGGWVE